MRRCPTCCRLFEDHVDTCADDGTPLLSLAVVRGTPEALDDESFAAISTRLDRPGGGPSIGEAERRLGTVFADKYALLDVLGTGGMGAVYEAENVWTGRRVAVKILRTEHLTSSEVVGRFLQEGRAAAQVAHPNIVQILDMGEDNDGALYIVQEFLIGINLRKRLRQGALPLLEALDVMLPILGALAAAHARGIVHRDVKPANIVLAKDPAAGEPVTKLIDFGIAKVLSPTMGTQTRASLTSTQPGSIVGTPAYMSPEQIGGAPDVDGRSDVWSVAVVLYELLVGRPAFRAPDSTELMRRILNAELTPLEAAAPHVPAEIARVVHRAIDRDRNNRTASMTELIEQLATTRVLSAEPAGIAVLHKHRGALPSPPPPRPASWRVAVEHPSWEHTQEWLSANAAKGSFFVAAIDPPPQGTAVDVLLALPEGRRVDLFGVVERAVPSDEAERTGVAAGASIRLDARHTGDLLVLEQEAGANAAPAFLAVRDLEGPRAAAKQTRRAQPSGKICPALGIDFGTTYTSAAVAIGDRVYCILDENGRALCPSIVTYADRGVPVVGWDARRALVTHPERTISAAKRLLGRSFSDRLLSGYLSSLPYRCARAENDSILFEIDDPPITPLQVCTLVIDHVRRTAEQQVGVRFDRAVLTVPVAFTPVQRAALKRAAERAGLTVLELIDEPVAAALSYGFGERQEQAVAVYDFGGGTFDFSLVRVGGGRHEVVVTDGDAWLGGDDLDLAIAQAAADELWRRSRHDVRRRLVEWQKLLFASERAKRALSTQAYAEIVVENVISHPERIDLRQSMTRERLEKIGAELFERSIEIVARTLLDARMRPEQVARIAATGGMSRIPAVRERLGRLFARDVTPVVNPEEAVCLGAAIRAATLADHPVSGAARRE